MTKTSTTDQAEIEAFAHLTTDQISGEVDRLAPLQVSTTYFLSTPSWQVDRDQEQLFCFRRELNRRLLAKIEADDAVSNAIVARLPIIHADTAAMWGEVA